MSLLVVQDLRLAFGKKVIFDDARFALGPRDRVGLVGANGTGKSSLLRILVGQQAPDSGRIQFSRRTRVGYLPQELTELPGGTLLASVLSSVPGRDELEARLAATQAQLADAQEEAEQLELSQTLADLHDELDHFEERHGRVRAERILSGLGFSAAQREGPVEALSGGWRMRAALAGLLLQDPDLLLLDEPTNHLDLPSLAWFDAFLRSSHKALLLISHDREFMNRHVRRVLALEPEALRGYTGDYDDYRRQREAEEEQLEAQAARQAAQRAETQEFIDRFRAKATKARQVQSRIKLLEKQEVITVREHRARVRFRFPAVTRAGKDVVRLEGVRKAYGDNVVYDGLSALLERGQKAAVVGRNGLGKTTLLKLIAGEIEPEAGEIVLGSGVTLAYYAQHQADALDRNATILEEVAALVPDQPQSFVRGVLGAFLFSGDDVDKKIGVLSGGERSRVALAKLLVRPANVMLMDEPTNHLDLASAEALIEALAAYEGTLLFVSHNRSFLNGLATHVWEVRDRKVVPSPGNMDDYLRRLSAEAALEEPTAEFSAAAAKELSAKDRRRVEAQERQRKSVRERPLREEIASLEVRIAALETAQKAREAQLVDPAFYADFAQSKPVLDAHRVAKAELEVLYGEWEDRQKRLAQLEAER
jgi:ATP-binding cassette subfamily F protein 3